MILVALAATAAGVLAHSTVRRGRAALDLRERLRTLGAPVLTALAGAAAGAMAGTLAATALGDPLVAPLGLALGWGAGDLWSRLRAEHQLLARTREAIPLLTRVEQEVQAGTHPVAALVWAARSEPIPQWLALRLDHLAATLKEGEPLARAAAAWAGHEEVPLVRMFAHLLHVSATWGNNLGPALRRLLREADQSVAFGAEERTEHRLYEILTAAFLVLDLLVGALALLAWPAAVPSPLTTAWGHLLLIGSALTTALAVSVPMSLAASSPPRLHPLSADEEHADA